jgi:hypothetical protein
MRQIEATKAFNSYQSGQQFIIDRLMKQADIADCTGETSGLEAEIRNLSAFGIELRQA